VSRRTERRLRESLLIAAAVALAAAANLFATSPARHANASGRSAPGDRWS
jgi:hypothetical protein